MKKILIVEDDASTSSLLKAYLIEKKLDADIAQDGLDALEKIKKSVPHLILLDVMMPRMDGYGFIRELKKDPKMRALPVIVLTAREMMRDVFVQEGVKDFVSKPFEPDELFKIISKYL